MSKTEVPETVLKALYAGYKYHLSLQISTDTMEGGQTDTQENMNLLIQHYHDWVKYTREAVAMLEAEE